MACWDNSSGSYSVSGKYFHFAIGRASSNVWWILSEDQDDPFKDDFPVGTFDRTADGDADEYPGPTLFTLPSSFTTNRDINGLLVDDSGVNPLFYILTNDEGSETYTVHLVDHTGSVLASYTDDFTGLGGFVFARRFVGFTSYGVVVHVSFSDFVTTDESFAVYDFDLGSKYTFFTESVPWGSTMTIGAQLAKNGSMWLVYPSSEYAGVYGAILYDPDGNYVEEYNTGLSTGGVISMGYDCDGNNLAFDYTPST